MLPASISARLNTQHETILSFISGDEASLRKRSNPDKWSLYENFVHLAAYQPVFLNRLKRVLNETDSPVFDIYFADKDPSFSQCLTLHKDELWKQVKEQREELINYISSLSDAQLLKTGIHQRYGVFTISDWTEFFLLHEAHHLFTMFMLKHGNR